MSFMRNPMVLWVRCMQNSIFPTKHFRGTSLQGFAQTNSLKHLHLISSKSQNIPLCSIPAEIYPKTQFSEQFRCCHLIFARSFSTSSHHAMPSYPLIKGTGSQEQEKILSEMNMRLVNENNFLSWCRNAYLSSVVGVAMITEGTTALAQSAGVGALIVGTMNLFWGTACHITNLIRLRNILGMSGYTLTLNVLGSTAHCLLWVFVLICYIGFLDETSANEKHLKPESSIVVPNMEIQHLDTRFELKDNEV